MDRRSARPDEQTRWVERSQRGVRLTRIIVLAPSFDLAPGVVKRQEPVGVQTLVSQSPVEGLYHGIVGGHARPAEVECDLIEIVPTERVGTNGIEYIFKHALWVFPRVMSVHTRSAWHLLTSTM